MRFGTVDTFLSLDPQELRLGRNVANHEFFTALLTYGSFDEVHVFLPDLAHLDVFRQRLSLVVPDAALRRRVRPGVLLALKEHLKDLEFDVFHQSDFTRFVPYLAPLRDRLAPRRFPITGLTHSLNTYLMPQRYLQLGLARMAPFDAIICTSRAGQEVVRKGFHQVSQRLRAEFGLEISLPLTLAHLPLGIADSRFEVPTRAQARAHLNLPAEGVILLVLGRISARTKLDLLPLLHSLGDRWQAGKLPNVRLLLAGGAEAADLSTLQRVVGERGIGDRVIFRPDFEDGDKVRLLAASDLFLSPSDNLQETFGLSVVEAMAAGVPPIVSDYDGYRELVIHGQTGIRVPTVWDQPHPALDGLEPFLALHHAFYLAQSFVVDLGAMMEAIDTLCADPVRRAQLGQAARLHAQQFRWSSLIPRYEALWRELKRQAGGTPHPGRPAPQPLELDCFPIFSHYPTRLLETDLLLALTDSGRAVLAGSPLPEPHRDMALMLFSPLLMGVLQALEASPCSVGRLEAHGAELEADAALVRSHLLWLLKYGLLRTVENLEPAPAQEVGAASGAGVDATPDARVR